MPANCDLAFITIPTMVRPAAGNGEEFCGGVLSELNDESTAGVVRGNLPAKLNLPVIKILFCSLRHCDTICCKSLFFCY